MHRIRYLLIARLLRLMRLLVLVERYKVMVGTFFKLIPSLTPYLGIIFCLMCLFCSLGIHVRVTLNHDIHFFEFHFPIDELYMIKHK